MAYGIGYRLGGSCSRFELGQRCLDVLLLGVEPSFDCSEKGLFPGETFAIEYLPGNETLIRILRLFDDRADCTPAVDVELCNPELARIHRLGAVNLERLVQGDRILFP